MKYQDFSIANKLYTLPAFILLMLIIIVSTTLHDYKSSLMSEKKEKTQSLVEVAYTAASGEIEKYKQGLQSEEQAKQNALNIIKALTYEDGNYYWVHNYDTQMVMHPKKPELIGKDLSKSADPDGKLLFVEMVDVVKKDGHGFVSYLWDKPSTGSDKPVPKIAFVKGLPEWEWIIGTGIYVDDVDAKFKAEATRSITLTAIAILIIAFLAWIATKSLATPLSYVTNALNKLALNQTIKQEYTDRKDEIGQMSIALSDLNDRLAQARKMEEEQKEQEKVARLEKIKMMMKLADDFDHKTGDTINSLSSSSGNLHNTAEKMQTLAKKTSESTEVVSNSSETASNNVNTVAAAMEEMSASISEIASQVTSAKDQSHETSRSANNANEKIGTLNELVGNIGEVVTSIQEIAEQTNLLALNATIEAARAGEAGKGFAVVAEEVKKLASETAAKTEEINDRILHIKSATEDSVGAVDQIIQRVTNIDTAITGISAAIEEQDLTTKEIVRSVASASQGVSQVATVITGVRDGANETDLSANTVLTASDEVAKLSENLKVTLSDFLKEVRKQE